METPSEARSNKTETKYLKRVSALGHNARVRARDVLSQMRDAAIVDAKRLGELETERRALAEAHRRYLANIHAAAHTAASLRAIEAFVGQKRFEGWVNDPNGSAILWLETDIRAGGDALRNETALWEHLRTLLQFFPKPRISEVIEILTGVGIKASRPAVESAIKAHPERFAVQRVGRERVVMLRNRNEDEK